MWPDGKKYEGYWYNGKQHGQGRFTNTAGKSRIGVWLNGDRLKWLPNNTTEVANLDPEQIAILYKEGNEKGGSRQDL